MKYLLVLCFCFSTFSQEMAILKKGESAPFDGILSDAVQMAEFRKINEENKILNQQNLKLKDLADIHDQRINLYKKEIDLVRGDVISSERKRFWTNIGYFALGVVITGLSAKVAIEATK